MAEVNIIDAKEEIESEVPKDSWMYPIIDYLKDSKLLEDRNQARKLRLKAAWYMLLEGALFKKSLSILLLSCVMKEESQIVLKTIHSGICGNHSGGRSLAHKALTTRYFWLYMTQDAQDYAKSYKKCQRHGLLIHQHSEYCHSVISPWSFIDAIF